MKREKKYGSKKKPRKLPKLPPGVTKYPDTARGVQQMLVKDSTLSNKDLEGAVFTPDPWVKGVWKVQLARVADDGWETTAVIAYLAGYPDPWGDIRDDNDFEASDDVRELVDDHGYSEYDMDDYDEGDGGPDDWEMSGGPSWG